MPSTLIAIFIYHFESVSMLDAEKILGSVKATTSTLDPFSSWLLKSSKYYTNEPLCITDSVHLSIDFKIGSYLFATLESTAREE